MSKRDLLIEIGTEELPPGALRSLSDAFAGHITRQLKDEELGFESVRPYATPRRLAVLITALDEKAPDNDVEFWGPPVKVAFKEGEPTRAAEAFAEKHGLDIDALQQYVDNDGKQDKLCYRTTAEGSTTLAILDRLVEEALANLPIPKRMRWGASQVEFVRPVHWVLLRFGNQSPDYTIMGVAAGNTTRGHRFHCNRELPVDQPADYETILREQGYVIADFAKRRQIIADQVQEAGHELGGHAVIDEDLLEEVTALVEWPRALAGSFEKRFLNVPPEALISSMKEHQKYFHVENREGHLMPHFITVANIESTDPAQVIDGNERVIRPRLADAAFFFDTDCQTTLASRREQLKGIVFQRKLGTVYDKTERIRALAERLAEKLDADREHAVRAAELCKSDLVTEMVGEFADMQGIAGYYYAKNDGEADDVARAMNEQYLPRFAGDRLPDTDIGTIIALADRLDTVVGIFGIGQVPTGSSDPFGLRRACLGILRLLVEKELPLDLRECIGWTIEQHGELPEAASLADRVREYIIERLRAWYEDRGIPAEVFMAVTAKDLSVPLDIDRRVHAVHEFSQLPQAQALAAANKRVSNLLRKSEGQVTDHVTVSLLNESAELELNAMLEQYQQQVKPLFREARYADGLKQLAELREPVDRFFDDVMVMVDDKMLRENRLALLNRLRSLFLEVADISLLAPAK